jgi:hypothetical protein
MHLMADHCHVGNRLVHAGLIGCISPLLQTLDSTPQVGIVSLLTEADYILSELLLRQLRV